ncbi:MAG: membrane protein insertase YidC [Deltaproteobacteria bacterium]|nr:membrane protein insertase YidC [Deltaproteobacteria bacterium]MBN2674061.1 membrane protein insertase YidC [Deltaproteobacteria bacterium]
MDWKILVGVILFLFVFMIYRSCSDEGPADYDKVQAEQQKARTKEFTQQQLADQAQKRTAQLNEARKSRGKRQPEKTAVIETELFRAELTSLGGALKSYTLKDHQYMEPPRDWTTGLKDENAKLKHINLVTTNPDKKYWAAFPLRFHIYEGLDGLLPDADFEIVKNTRKTAIFRYEQEGIPVVIYKKFEVAKAEHPYQIWLTVRVVNKGEQTISFRPGIIQSGFQPEEEAESGIFAPQPNLMVGECLANDEMFAEPWEKIEESHVSTNVKFAGVGSNYFVAAMIPGDEHPTTCRVSQENSRVIRADLQWGELDVKPGKDIVLKVKNYIGPKKYQILETVGHNLEKSVDYGWFAPISRVLLWLLFKFQAYVVNWGIAIILLTVLIKLALIPLTNKSFKSSNAMKALKPEMDKLNEKYKDDPQEKQKAIMALYKSKGVNPLGGCLPMVLQMPIWFALFRTLRSSPELYRAPFFGWITDLSDADPYFITPLVMGAMMFVQQKMMPVAGDNAQAKMMLYFMPIMFTVMMAFLPSGLTLYILVNTVLSILHQWILKKRSDAQAAVPAK